MTNCGKNNPSPSYRLAVDAVLLALLEAGVLASMPTWLLLLLVPGETIT